MKLSKTNIIKMHDAVSKMNETITIGERNAVNAFKFKLWELADQIQDISHFPSMKGHPLTRISDELKDTINKFPTLYA